MQTKQVFTDRQWDILRAVHVWQFAGVDELRLDGTVVTHHRVSVPVADVLIGAMLRINRVEWRPDADALAAAGYLTTAGVGPVPIGHFRADGVTMRVSTERVGGALAIVVRSGGHINRYLSSSQGLPRCRFYSLTATGVDALAATDAPDRVDDLVTLDQAAAVIGLSKRTLERYATSGKLPTPDIQGGGGRAHRWFWHTLKPALEAVSERKLPNRFPASRIR